MSNSSLARSLWRGLIAVALIVTLASCSSAPGNASTDRQAAEAANRISWPRQSSADALVRAAVGTSEISAGFQVVEADDLDAGKLGDPLARLVFRIHDEGSLSGFIRSDPVTACYEAMFSFYGVIGGPRRINCPVGAKAILPDPLPSKPHVVIPIGFESTLAKLLAALPAAPTAADVRARLSGALASPAVDPATGLRDLLPAVETAVSGFDIGVSLWEADDRDCLLGARIGGQVTVWRPTRVQLMPGELTCDPQTALQSGGLHPPH